MYCDKEIEGGIKKYCNFVCRRRRYYQKNRDKILKYQKKYGLTSLHNFCRCGGKKYVDSKQCWKCYRSHKYKCQLSRLA